MLSRAFRTLAVTKMPAVALEADHSVAGPLSQSVKERIHSGIPDIRHFAMYNDSYKHRGHREHSQNNSESHLRLEITSDYFEGMTLVRRHRLVYDLLNTEIREHGLHALQLHLKTVAEAERAASLQGNSN